MEFSKDIGKFVQMTFKTSDGVVKHTRGVLDIDEEGFLVFVHLKFPNTQRRIKPEEITIIDYTAEPVEVKQDD
jgi:hypothetical protein